MNKIEFTYKWEIKVYIILLIGMLIFLNILPYDDIVFVDESNKIVIDKYHSHNSHFLIFDDYTKENVNLEEYYQYDKGSEYVLKEYFPASPNELFGIRLMTTIFLVIAIPLLIHNYYKQFIKKSEINFHKWK